MPKTKIFTFIIAGFLILGASYALAAWAPPPSFPPSVNPVAPLDESSSPNTLPAGKIFNYSDSLIYNADSGARFVINNTSNNAKLCLNGTDTNHCITSLSSGGLPVGTNNGDTIRYNGTNWVGNTGLRVYQGAPGLTSGTSVSINSNYAYDYLSIADGGSGYAGIYMESSYGNANIGIEGASGSHYSSNASSYDTVVRANTGDLVLRATSMDLRPAIPIWTTGNIRFTTGGNRFTGGDSERMVIMENGNVGIGTRDDISSLIANIPNKMLHLFKTTGSDNTEIDIQSLPGANNYWAIYHDRVGGSGQLRFWNNNITGQKNALVIATTTGSVGIATVTPHARLEVQGDLIFGGATNDANVGGNIAGANLAFLANSSSGLLGWNRSSGDGEIDLIANRGLGSIGGFRFIDYPNSGTENTLVTMRGNGNVGIGTTAPIEKITVNGAVASQGASTVGVLGNASGTAMFDYSGGGARFLSFSSSPSDYGKYVFYQQKANTGGYRVPMMIFETGRIGMGITDPSVADQLTVVSSNAGTGNAIYGGQTLSTGNGVVGVAVGGNGIRGLSTNQYGVFGYTNGTVATSAGVRGEAYNGSSYGVYAYNSAATGYGMYCYGATCGGNRAWTGTSDGRLKENIYTITDALTKVQKLRGVNFTWKDAQGKALGQQMGFIAQEVLPVVPEVVTKNPDGYYAMTTASLNALLVEAVKEQQKEIQVLKDQVDKLSK
jgi:hypothetical protein